MNRASLWVTAAVVVAWSAFAACGGDSSDEPASGGSGGSMSGGSDSGGASSGGTTATGGTAGGDTACEAASDCGWGELTQDILEPSDCPCLLGCPYLPLRQDAVDRRLQQYQQHCDPFVDGEGNPCPVDECVPPPEPTCVNNVCGPEDPFG